MRVKTLRVTKKEDFDYTVNDYIRLATEQGCEIQFIQITHLPTEFVATIVYQEYIANHEERAPEFIEASDPLSDPVIKPDEPVLEVDGKEYANVDAYEKY